jgi:hypothetical protein
MNGSVLIGIGNKKTRRITPGLFNLTPDHA